MELGRTGFKPRDVADLCTLYGLTDDAERAALLDLVRAANSAEWWHAYRDVYGLVETYLGLEQAAAVIRSYEPLFIPGCSRPPPTPPSLSGQATARSSPTSSAASSCACAASGSCAGRAPRTCGR